MGPYIWEHDSWPAFTWDAGTLAPALAEAHAVQIEVATLFRRLDEQARAAALLEARSNDAVETSRIEGEIIDPRSIRSSIARRLRLPGVPVFAADKAAEAIAAITIDATARAHRPLTLARLNRWNAILLRDHADLGGRLRRGAMRVVSGAYGRERVHFEAPPAVRLAGDMHLFLRWIDAHPEPDGIIVAGLAHLWFVTIHPYEDGNGRISRAIADLLLMRAFPEVSQFVSMTRAISHDRAGYYAALQVTQSGDIDVTSWLAWFIACYARAAKATIAAADAALMRRAFMARAAAGGINERQAAVLGRLLDGFEGNLTAKRYAGFVKTSEDTALRDLADLANKGLIVRVGAARATAYRLVTAVS
jgi:Fic family protein